jgi:hypothetical protein
MTLAQCRITDSICVVSLKQAADLVSKISSETEKSAVPSKPLPY